MKAIRGALAALALVSLTACPGPITSMPTPAEVADRMKIDEQAALTVTLAYTAAARAAALAIQTGVVSDRATIQRIGDADTVAKKAVDTVECAYRAANALTYTAALTQARCVNLLAGKGSLPALLAEARSAVSLFLSSVKG